MNERPIVHEARSIVHEEYLQVARFLKAKREALGLSRKEAALTIGYCNSSELCLIENAKAPPSTSKIHHFRLAYDLTDDEYFMIANVYWPEDVSLAYSAVEAIENDRLLKTLSPDSAPLTFFLDEIFMGAERFWHGYSDFREKRAIHYLLKNLH